MTLNDFRALVALTLRDPGRAARTLLGLGVPMQARWMALLLAVSVSGLLAWLSSALVRMPADLPPGEDAALALIAAQPLMIAVLQLGAILLAAGLMSAVGRAFGGQGRFEDALLLTVWIEIVMLIVQIVQTLAMLILPPLAGIFGVIAIALFLWLTVQFTKALHGFTSTARVAAVMLATVLVAGFVMSFVAAAFGLMPGGPQ